MKYSNYMIYESHFTLLARKNGKVILTSETYQSASGILRGIESVKRNSTTPDMYKLLDAKDGRYYFTLRAGNNKVIGTSQMYRTKFGRWVGIRSVKKNADPERTPRIRMIEVR